MKKYIKPVSDVIQTEVICNTMIQATVISGKDQTTAVDNIPVYENQDPKGNNKNTDGTWGDDAWGPGTWGGD